MCMNNQVYGCLVRLELVLQNICNNQIGMINGVYNRLYIKNVLPLTNSFFCQYASFFCNLTYTAKTVYNDHHGTEEILFLLSDGRYAEV